MELITIDETDIEAVKDRIIGLRCIEYRHDKEGAEQVIMERERLMVIYDRLSNRAVLMEALSEIQDQADSVKNFHLGDNGQSAGHNDAIVILERMIAERSVDKGGDE